MELNYSTTEQADTIAKNIGLDALQQEYIRVALETAYMLGQAEGIKFANAVYASNRPNFT